MSTQSESVGLRGNKLQQHNTVVGGHQGLTKRRGYIRRIDPHNQLAVVAVQGGDPSTNPRKVKAFSLKKGEEGLLDLPEANQLGSYYTDHIVKLPSGAGGSTAIPTPGVSVLLEFIQGTFNPVIVGYEHLLEQDKPNSSDPVLLVDESAGGGTGFVFTHGGPEIGWTAMPGIPGYRFAPFSQNAIGGHVQVATAFNLENLLRSVFPTPKTIRKALVISTPTGTSVWVDNDGQGHWAAFADQSHLMVKNQDRVSLGSSMPESTHLKNPLNDLARAMGIEPEEDPTPMTFDTNSTLRMSPALTALASAELEAWQLTSGGFVALAQILDGFLGLSNTGTGKLATKLQTASKGNTNAGLNYTLSAAIAAGLASVGNVMTVGSEWVQAVVPYLVALPFDPEDDHPNLLANLTGTGQAWAALVAALRSALLVCPEAATIKNGLKVTPLTIYKADTESKPVNGLAVPNLFGFPKSDVGVAGLKGNVNFLRTLTLPAGYAFAEPVGKDSFTYGDLVHFNLHELRSESLAWSGVWTDSVGDHTDVMVPNHVAMAGTASGVFSDRIYFGLAGMNVPGESGEFAIAAIKNWSAGLYAAQVRTLMQEIIMIIKQYPTDLFDATGSSDGVVLHPARTVRVTDDLGNLETAQIRAWSSSFIGYLMLRLFTGDRGHKAARELLTTYAGKVDELTKEDFQKIIDKYQTGSDQLEKAWWKSVPNRFKIVANTLARSRNLWKV